MGQGKNRTGDPDLFAAQAHRRREPRLAQRMAQVHGCPRLMAEFVQIQNFLAFAPDEQRFGGATNRGPVLDEREKEIIRIELQDQHPGAPVRRGVVIGPHPADHERHREVQVHLAAVSRPMQVGHDDLAGAESRFGGSARHAGQRAGAALRVNQMEVQLIIQQEDPLVGAAL